MPLKPSYLIIAGAGALIGVAGIKGWGIGSTFRDIIAGKDPSQNPSLASQIVSAHFGSVGAGGSSGGSGVSVGKFSATASEQSYFSAVLRNLGAPVTQANLQAMYRWATKEEPSFPAPTSWTWNPLNIKDPATGSFASYASPSLGAAGTAAFMANNNYGAIIASLKTGNGIQDSPAVAAELSAWSGGGYTSVNSGGG